MVFDRIFGKRKREDAQAELAGAKKELVELGGSEGTKPTGLSLNIHTPEPTTAPDLDLNALDQASGKDVEDSIVARQDLTTNAESRLQTETSKAKPAETKTPEVTLEQQSEFKVGMKIRLSGENTEICEIFSVGTSGSVYLVKSDGRAIPKISPERLQDLKKQNRLDVLEPNSKEAKIFDIEKRQAKRREEIRLIREELKLLMQQIASSSPEAKGDIVHGEAFSLTKEGMSENQDAVLVDNENQLYAVFDGMGGHSDGALASRTAAEYIKERVLERNLGFNDVNSDYLVAEDMQDLIISVNREVSKLGHGKSDKPGTTISIVKIVSSPEGRRLVIGNIGDSRVFIQHANGVLRQVTDDDNGMSPFETLRISNAAQESDLNEQELRRFRTRNQISRCLGDSNLGEVKGKVINISNLNILRVVITSDGIHDNLTNDEIEKLLQQDARAEVLAHAAQKRSREHSFRSKADDMTALVIDLKSGN